MKNKKLFAILTLVCFMMTLMPVAAFAAEVTAVKLDASHFTASVATTETAVDFNGNVNIYVVKDGKVVNYEAPKAKGTAAVPVPRLDAIVAGNNYVAAASADVDDTVAAADIVKGAEVVAVAEEAVAAVADTAANAADLAIAGKYATLTAELAKTGAAYNASAVLTAAKDVQDEYEKVTNPDTQAALSDASNKAYAKALEVLATVKPTTGGYAAKSTFATVDAGLELDINELGEAVVRVKDQKGLPTNDKVYVWAETVNGEASAAFGASGTGVTRVAGTNVFEVVVTATGANTFNIAFTTADTYTLKATLDTVTAATSLVDTVKISLPAAYNTVKVNSPSVNSKAYKITVNGETLGNNDVATKVIAVEANGVGSTSVVGTLTYNGSVLPGVPVTIETNSSSIAVSTTKATTNYNGELAFRVSGTVEGNYEIYLECGSYTATLPVTVGAIAPAYIEVVKTPEAPFDINKADLTDVVRFLITDINGNVLRADSAKVLSQKAATGADKGIYASIVSQPADSKLTNKDVTLVADGKDGLYATLAIGSTGLKAEGTYEFKVTLDNGKSANVTVEVKEFTTPVAIVLEYAAPSVELGGTLGVKKLAFVDANGVTTDVYGVDLAASGYAIQSFAQSGTYAGTIVAKNDEKYLGSEITVTAVSERYDLITTATVKVVADAAGLMFTSKTAEANVNNAIQVVLVDAMGNRTALSHGASADVSYVVLEKPADAKVSVATAPADYYLTTAGSFKMNLTCNKVGTVKVQAIAKVQDGGVTKYYTGVGEIAVGTGETGKSVVMSIGSNTMIADGKAGDLLAAPMIKDGRTFVPFRALAQAFGATVAYDQATSAVTAELNGVKVVMTIGSPVYTVNGVEKTADVVPFIVNDSTMVPVRFAAEAFGITVTPTYHADGSVADVLFNM